MKNFLIILSIFGLVLVSQYNFASEKTGEKLKVNHRADSTRMRQKGDTSFMLLMGSVYFYHNDAIISCDSAYYFYQTSEFEGMGNVIINQDLMHIYGDKVTFNQTTGKAQVFAPIIKIVDSTTIMYTINLIYDTNTSLAEYFDGGTITQNNNILESDRGYYDSKNRIAMLRHNVVMENEDYDIKTDSLDFYMDTEMLDYECRTYIWRKNGDFLQSDKGKYYEQKELFVCEKNSYVMTAEQEVWADSISYYSRINQLILKSNIQLLDTVKKMYAFGDYGQYWTDKEHILLTQNPSVVNYYDNDPDSLYMRSDTFFIRPFLNKLIDTTAVVPDSIKLQMDEQSREIAIDSTIQERFGGDIHPDGISLAGDNIANIDSLSSDMPIDELILDTSDSTAMELITDSLLINAPAIDTLAVDSLLINAPAIDTLAVDSLHIVDPMTLLIDSLILLDKVDLSTLTKLERREYKRRQRDMKKLARKERFVEWLREGGMHVEIDSSSSDTTDIDSSLMDITELDTTDQTKVKIENLPDSSDYIIRGIINSKVFKIDVQMVCDSIITETVDSTTTFIGEPILWNENNQITSKRTRTFVKNGELYRARLFNKPILGQHVMDTSYTQMKGEYMDAMFRNNSIYRLYVNDATETIYFKLSDPPEPFIEGLTFVTSVNMIVDLDSTEISRIGWYMDIEQVTYPIDLVPETQPRKLQGFLWQPEKKPTKEMVFNRHFVATYREEAMKIKKPYLSITEMIKQMKKVYINDGTWRDRTDVIPPNYRTFTEL